MGIVSLKLKKLLILVPEFNTILSLNAGNIEEKSLLSLFLIAMVSFPKNGKHITNSFLGTVSTLGLLMKSLFRNI